MDSKQFLTNGNIESQESHTTSAHVKRSVSLEKFPQRRCSPRLKGVPHCKRPYYGTSLKDLQQQQQHDDHVSSFDDYNLNYATKVNAEDVHGDHTTRAINLVQCNSDYVQQRNPPNVITQNAAPTDPVNDSGTASVDLTSSAADHQCTTVEPSNNNCIQSFTSSPTLDGKSSYAPVKESIRTINTYYLQLVQVITPW